MFDQDHTRPEPSFWMELAYFMLHFVFLGLYIGIGSLIMWLAGCLE